MAGQQVGASRLLYTICQPYHLPTLPSTNPTICQSYWTMTACPPHPSLSPMATIACHPVLPLSIAHLLCSPFPPLNHICVRCTGGQGVIGLGVFQQPWGIIIFLIVKICSSHLFHSSISFLQRIYVCLKIKRIHEVAHGDIYVYS